MPDTLREYDEARREVRLSEALDHPNRVFQLVHVCALIEHREALDAILDQSGIAEAAAAAPAAASSSPTTSPPPS